jgi:glycosyltransferase involved in cell wall biosynthesis
MMIMLLSGLDQERYEIYVASKDNGPLIQKIKDNGWTHIPIKYFARNFSIKDLFVVPELYKIIKNIKPDIVHTHSSKPGFLGRIISKILKVKKIIHTIHGFPFHPYQNPIIRFIYQNLERLAAEAAHYNVFVNHWERLYAIEKLRFNPNKAITIYNGIDPFVIARSETTKQSKNSFNHPQPSPTCRSDNDLKIVSVSRFCEQKNILFTLKKAIEIVKKHQNVTFTFYGDGELFKFCKTMINENNTQDQISLEGWKDNINELLPNFDVYLLNSLWEGLSLSILEAMAAGLPIICSNIKGNNELVDQTNGWLIDPKSDIDLMQTVQEILNDKKILLKKGEESINKVTSDFNYELFIKGYKNLYENN